MDPEPHISQRYDMARVADGVWWAVIDLFTGMPAVVEGATLDRLEMAEADDMVDLLNDLERKRMAAGMPGL